MVVWKLITDRKTEKNVITVVIGIPLKSLSDWSGIQSSKMQPRFQKDVRNASSAAVNKRSNPKKPLLYSICKKSIDWNNRGKHGVGKKHRQMKAHALVITLDLDGNMSKVQQRIVDGGLVGQTYTKNQIDDNMLWLLVSCRGNLSLKSISDNSVSIFCLCPCSFCFN